MPGSAPIRSNPWIVTIAVMLATFMEVLDTTVVNVSVPHMAGNMGATYEEGTWVVTSYLVSNAIILPMAGWLAMRFGRRRMLMLCVTGFTISSLLCGMATSLESLIFFRVLQGLSGGGLQPLSQSVLLETFPPKKHGTAMAAFGLGIIIAPILGPTLGGWITDNYTWRWIFYINLPVGILSLLMISHFIIDPPYLRKTKLGGVDLWGIGFLALGFGLLQMVLDTGQRKDWFGSNQIRLWTALCVIGLVGMVVRELTAKHPIVDLRVLKDCTFAAGTLVMTMLGFVLYASLMLLPIYLQTLLGLSGDAIGTGAVAARYRRAADDPDQRPAYQSHGPAQAAADWNRHRRVHHVQPLAPESQCRLLGHFLAADYSGRSHGISVCAADGHQHVGHHARRRWAMPPASTT